MRGPVATLVSAVERQATRDRTLAQLQAVGITPAIILNTPNRSNWHHAKIEQARYERANHEVMVTGDPRKGWGNRNNALAFTAAFRYAHEQRRGLLYFEDDLEVAPDFPWFLNQAIDADVATWFYAHEQGRAVRLMTARYGTRIWNRIRMHAQAGTPFTPKGLYTVHDTETLMSGQAFYLPYRVLNALPLHELERQGSPVDRWTQHRVTKIGECALIALPHPVQHLHDRTGREKGRNAKASITFHLR